MLERLPLRGWDLRVEPVLRAGIAATRAVVDRTDDVRGAHPRPHRGPRRRGPAARPGWPSGRWPSSRPWPRSRARLHRRPPRAGPLPRGRLPRHHRRRRRHGGRAGGARCRRWSRRRPVATGTGTVRSAHGFLPNPVAGGGPPARRTSPPGVGTSRSSSPPRPAPPSSPRWRAASARCRRCGSSRRGFGAGTQGDRRAAQLHPGRGGRPPCAGPRAAAASRSCCSRPTSTTSPGRCWPTRVGALLDAGAHDAWITPVVMKKGRPGYVLSVLADPALVEALRAVLQARDRDPRRAGAARWSGGRRPHGSRSTSRGSRCRVKVSPGRVKAEFDDAARVAGRTGAAPARGEPPGRVRRGTGTSRPRTPPSRPPADPAPA